jgi:hypothetical protein
VREWVLIASIRENHAKQKGMKKVILTPEIQIKCTKLLSTLDSADIGELYAYAEGRLFKIGLPRELSEDIAQSALASVIRGIEGGNCGRCPKLEDLESTETLKLYLRRVIMSISDSRLPTIRYHRMHQQLMDCDVQEVDNAAKVDEEAGWNDLRREFFSRMRQRIRPGLANVLAEWEKVFMSSDRIPGKTRKYAWELRRIARQIMLELGEDDRREKDSLKGRDLSP